MAEASARQVADHVISFLSEHGDPVSNLKLQKLLYYCQAWYLALYDVALFDERIEAWTHGPCVPPVYGAFKQWQWNPIPPPGDAAPLEGRPEAHAREVIEVYGNFSAYQLERMTHEEEPWQKARRGLSPDEPSNNVISHEDMKSFYRARLDVQDQSREAAADR